MKKVECPSCGATGIVLLRPPWPSFVSDAHLCTKCNGFGFALIDPAEFAKFKKVKNRRRVYTGEVYLGSTPEYQEFTGLCKVRNFRNRLVWIPGRGYVPYSVFYKEHRNPR